MVKVGTKKKAPSGAFFYFLRPTTDRLQHSVGARKEIKMMKLAGFACNVENPAYASNNPFEAVYAGDAYKVFEDEKGFKWIEIAGSKWIYEGKVYSTEQWEEEHWALLSFPE